MMHVNCRYIGRLCGMMREFSARFSDIHAIYRQALAVERVQEQPKWWKRLWTKFWRRYTTDSMRMMDFMTTLDENQVISITSSALNGPLGTHLQFAELHGLKLAAAAVVQDSTASAASRPSASLLLNLNSSANRDTSSASPGTDQKVSNLGLPSVQCTTDEQMVAQRKTSQRTDESKSAHSSLGFVEIPKSFKPGLIRSVIDNLDPPANVQRVSSQQQRANVRRDNADQGAVFVSTPASSVILGARASKIASELMAPERKSRAKPSPPELRAGSRESDLEDEFGEILHVHSTVRQDAPAFSIVKPPVRWPAGESRAQNQVDMEEIVIDRMSAVHDRKPALSGANRAASVQSMPQQCTSGNVEAPSSPVSWTRRFVPPAAASIVKVHGADSRLSAATAARRSAIQARRDAKQRSILRIESELASVSGASDAEAPASSDMRASPSPQPPWRHDPVLAPSARPLSPPHRTLVSSSVGGGVEAPPPAGLPDVQPQRRALASFAGSGIASGSKAVPATGTSDRRSAIQARQDSAKQYIATDSKHGIGMSFFTGASDAEAPASSDMRASPSPQPPWRHGPVLAPSARPLSPPQHRQHHTIDMSAAQHDDGDSSAALDGTPKHASSERPNHSWMRRSFNPPL
jgi:hypothetical protein